jgi:hypothetical protein
MGTRRLCAAKPSSSLSHATSFRARRTPSRARASAHRSTTRDRRSVDRSVDGDVIITEKASTSIDG